jgi:hypothetical protein
MYSIEEMRNLSPTLNHKIPHGAIVEFGPDRLRQALQAEHYNQLEHQAVICRTFTPNIGSLMSRLGGLAAAVLAIVTSRFYGGV